MLSITFPRRCQRTSKLCYFNVSENIKFQFKGSVAVNILLEERIMWGSSDEHNNSPRPFGLGMPVWPFFLDKNCNFGVKWRKYFRKNLPPISQIQLILLFWIPNAHFYLKQKKKGGKVRTWEDSQISVLLISIRTFCSSSINLGNNWCRIQFVLMVKPFQSFKAQRFISFEWLTFLFLAFLLASWR